jgi:C-terminal processing protease CtpA/Prc
MSKKLIKSTLFLFVTNLLALSVFAQSLSSFDRQRNKEIISSVKSILMENYYDPTFRGLDLETKFQEVEEINKQAKSNSEVFVALAAVLIDLNDSHTNFIPPSRMNKVDYGWGMKSFGDKCFISYVKSRSDAEKKGLQVGDEILSLDIFKPNRKNLWQMNYLYYALSPREQVKLVVRSPDGKVKEMEIQSKIIAGRRLNLTNYVESSNLIMKQEKEAGQYEHRFAEFEKELIIWKMPVFDLPKNKVDDYMDRIGKFKNVIIDLRGNGGGAEETLLRLIGNFIDRDLKIGDLTRRKEKKELIAKTRGKPNVYQGNVFVLVDSESGSSSELFARVMQMEARGTIIGDLTSGSVMRSRFFPKEVGVNVVSFYGVSVTDADLIMTDGKSLERVGVTPDKLMMPSPSDLAKKRDVVLSNAASLAGVVIEPEKAGALFSKHEKK